MLGEDFQTRRADIWKPELLVVDGAWKAIFWPTPGFKRQTGRTMCSSRILVEGTFISASMVPHHKIFSEKTDYSQRIFTMAVHSDSPWAFHKKNFTGTSCLTESKQMIWKYTTKTVPKYQAHISQKKSLKQSSLSSKSSQLASEADFPVILQHTSTKTAAISFKGVHPPMKQGETDCITQLRKLTTCI